MNKKESGGPKSDREKMSIGRSAHRRWQIRAPGTASESPGWWSIAASWLPPEQPDHALFVAVVDVLYPDGDSTPFRLLLGPGEHLGHVNLAQSPFVRYPSRHRTV